MTKRPYAAQFPLTRIPDPADWDPDLLDQLRTELERTRNGVAPNPAAQALYPPCMP